jgi:hypothetical protein
MSTASSTATAPLLPVAEKRPLWWVHFTTKVAKFVAFVQKRPERFYMWDYAMFLICVYMWVEVTLRAAFNLSEDIPGIVSDQLLDLVLITDIALHCVRPIEERGEYTYKIRRIIKHYAVSYMLPDILASLPLEFLALAPTIGFLPSLRLNRLLRLYRLGYYFSIFQEGSAINPSTVRSMKFSFIFLLTSHFIACAWFAVLSYEGRDTFSVSFAGDDGILDRPPASQYMRAILWSVQMLPNYVDTPPSQPLEFVISLATVIVGVCVYMLTIGVVASVMVNNNASTKYYRDHLESINHFMNFHRLPAEIKTRVHEYFAYLWNSRKGLDETDVLKDLPSYLRIEIAMFLNRDIIMKVPLFRGQTDHFISAVVSKLRPRVFLPGYFVIRKGDIGREMFFIARGKVEVVSEDGNVVYATLSDGSFFGEVALLFSGKRTASVRAASYCDMFILSKDELRDVLKEFPEESRQLQEEARTRYAITSQSTAGSGSSQSAVPKPISRQGSAAAAQT